MIVQAVTLGAYVGTYILERGINPVYAGNLCRYVAHFEAWHGRPVALAELEAPLVNRYLADLDQTGRAACTIKNYRAAIVALWNAAFDSGLCDFPPARIRTVKRAIAPPRALTLAEIRALLKTAQSLPGTFRHNGIAKAAWWDAYVRVAYDSGLRHGDMLKLTHSTIDGGRFWVIQSKTHSPVECVLTGRTMEAVGRLGTTDVVFPWHITREEFFRAFRYLRDRCPGVPQDCTLKWVRRSSASYAELAEPGAGAKQLGHSPKSGGIVAAVHYLDPRIVGTDHARPPALE